MIGGFICFIKNVYKLLLILLLIPLRLYAYSDYIIASGENIGIKLISDGIIIVGTYDVDGTNPANDAGLKVGDIIEKVDNTKVNSIDDMVSKINESRSDEVNITYKRGNDIKNTSLVLDRTGSNVKTGLYVKDSITGIGTLTYIDPKTKIFGALGHQIINWRTLGLINVKVNLPM